MRTQLKSLGIALMLALPAALPAVIWTTPAHAQAASLQAAQANYYKNLVDFDFVKQWVQIPPRKGVMLIDARPAARNSVALCRAIIRSPERAITGTPIESASQVVTPPL